MAGEDLEKGDARTETFKSSSSSSTDSSSDSTAKTSPPSSPEDDPAQPAAQAEPEVESVPRFTHIPHSSTPPRRGNRRNGGYPQSALRRLGAIDEDSSSIAPDVPTRSPDRPRKFVSFAPTFDAKKFFTYNRWAHDDSVPPPDVYEKITGPNGEKFNDVRQNRPFRSSGTGRWRRAICVGCIVLVILAVLGIALGVGLGVGLAKKKAASSEDVTPPTSSSPSTNNAEEFPLGTWAIPTFLTNTSTSCTSNSATWLCYPYSTYDQSTTTSFSTLTWQITSPSNSTIDLRISNTNPTFSYPFTDVPLSVSNANDITLSAFTFEFTYRKQVVPTADITGDNSATRCYYNNTRVAVNLYNNQQGAGGGVVGAPSGLATEGVESWPYAIEYDETIFEGPQCFRYANGVEGAEVEVTAGGGECECIYKNFGLS